MSAPTRLTPFSGQAFTLSDERAEPLPQRSYCAQMAHSISDRCTYVLNELTDLISRVCNCFYNCIWDELLEVEEEEDEFQDVLHTMTITQLTNEVVITHSETIVYE